MTFYTTYANIYIMTKEQDTRFTPARQPATRRQRAAHGTHSHGARGEHADASSPNTKGKSGGGNTTNWGRRLGAGVAGTAAVVASVVGYNVVTDDGGQGLAAREEAQLIDTLHLRDAVEKGEQVRANLVPATIQLRAGAIVRDEPPTYIEAGHTDTVARRIDREQLLTRPAIIPGTNTDDIPMLMFYPEGSVNLEDAVYVPLTEENVGNMQFWLSDGVPLERPITYADLAYGFDEGVDLNNSVDNLGVVKGADGVLSFSFTREGQNMPAMSASHVSNVTGAMAEAGMRPVTLDAPTFPEGPTVPPAE